MQGKAHAETSEPTRDAEREPVVAGALDLDNYVVALLTWVNYKLSADASALYKKLFGYSIAEWRVIAYLGAKGSGTAAEIAGFQGIDKAGVSRSIAILTRAGILVQESAKGRRMVLSLTSAGVELYNRILAVALARESVLLDGFSDTDRKQAIALLHRMHANIPKVIALGKQLRAP